MHIRLLTVVLLVIAPLLGGCNIIGPAAHIIAGPGTVPAEYAIEDRATVVFIDDRENVVNPIMLRRHIADRVSQDLMQKKLVTRTIDSQDAMSLAARTDTASNVMPIDAIGRSVGAEQIIYVEMLAFTDRMDDDLPRGYALCRVRVIDVVNRVRLFPAPDLEQPYRTVEVVTPEVSEELYRTRGTRMQIYEMLAQEMGSAVGKLFYKHEPRELGGRLGGR